MPVPCILRFTFLPDFGATLDLIPSRPWLAVIARIERKTPRDSRPFPSNLPFARHQQQDRIKGRIRAERTGTSALERAHSRGPSLHRHGDRQFPHAYLPHIFIPAILPAFRAINRREAGRNIPLYMSGHKFLTALSEYSIKIRKNIVFSAKLRGNKILIRRRRIISPADFAMEISNELISRRRILFVFDILLCFFFSYFFSPRANRGGDATSSYTLCVSVATAANPVCGRHSPGKRRQPR